MASPWNNRSVYHFTPLSNLEAILQHGLLAVNEQQRLGYPMRTLSGAPVLEHRRQTPVPVGPGGNVLDYVPFYFSNLNHMLLVIISSKVVDEQHILHIELPLSIIERYPVVFTDGPILPWYEPDFYADPADLHNLDWEAIDAPAWSYSRINLRTPQLSELLVHRGVPIREATRIIVWDNQIADTVQGLYEEYGIRPPRIETDPAFYFYDPTTDERRPPIAGPTQIWTETRQTIEFIQQTRRHGQQGRFSTLTALRDALRVDLEAIPETAELVGLETDNRVHFEDVGAHTLRVVELVRGSDEFKSLEPADQVLMEVAAYLHDIGKGPKSRWHDYGGRQQIDMNHPVKALPMLERILTEEVRYIEPEDVDLLCRLVAYHDIIGGILVSGRRIEELLQAFHTERELEMLFQLARADSLAINPAWEHPELRSRLKQEVLQTIRQQDSA